VAVDESPFRGSTAFLLGNEGDGISTAQQKLCDHFVYIRQYGNGTASLNVTVAASIIFHRFACWAQLDERPRDPQNANKFAVDFPSIEEQQNSETAQLKRAQRAQRRGSDDDDTTVREIDVGSDVVTAALPTTQTTPVHQCAHDSIAAQFKPTV
jgi:tRNA C32,U32 (ribose-2'-O)-methylase TrmJ